jgi:hypothetical protein
LPRKTRSNVSLNRNSIIGSIERSESKGLKVNAIVRDTGLGRATVERYLRDLEGGYIVKKENKQAPYHLTQKLNGDPKSKAFLFQSEAFRQLGNLNWLSSNSKFLNPKIYNRKFNSVRNEKNQDLLDQFTLLDFANRLSSIILYTLLQVIRPYMDSYKLDKEAIELKGKKRDDIARTWIKSLNPQLIFREFSKLDMIKKGRAIHNLDLDPMKTPESIIKTKSLNHEERTREIMRVNTLQSLNDEQQKTLEQNPEIKKDFNRWLKEYIRGTRLYSPDNPEWSLYEMEENSFSRLIKAYAPLYPEIYSDLEHICEGLPGKIEGIRKSKVKIIKLKKCSKCARPLYGN